MTAKLTRAQWIAHAIHVHGNAYDYSQVVYCGMRQPVTIICPIHGPFVQRANSHVNCGHGCPHCATTKKAQAQRDTTEEFIAKARKQHGDRYDYSQTTYSSSGEKVTIICREHGPFTQRASNHLYGNHCPRCRARHQALTPIRCSEPARHIMPMPIHPLDKLLRAARSPSCGTNTAA